MFVEEVKNMPECKSVEDEISLYTSSVQRLRKFRCSPPGKMIVCERTPQDGGSGMDRKQEDRANVSPGRTFGFASKQTRSTNIWQ